MNAGVLREELCRSDGEPLLRALRGDPGLEVVANFGEFGVDFAGKTVEASDGDDRNQGGDQGVLDQILARFIVQESAEALCHELSLTEECQGNDRQVRVQKGPRTSLRIVPLEGDGSNDSFVVGAGNALYSSSMMLAIK
jgi:hypothetical protein